MRRILAVIFAALLLLATIAPAGAYYGQWEGVINYSFTAADRGCYARITVLQGKRVQAYCNLKNSEGFIMAKSNYYEYDCWWPEGCEYEVYIQGWDGWEPVAFSIMKKDDYWGLHCLINESYSMYIVN